MSDITDFLNKSGELGERLAHRLRAFEEQLSDAVRTNDRAVDKLTAHLSDAGGKRLRPLLCFLTAELGPDPLNTHVMHSALVVELTHLASLYHDDVIDDAPLRRGVSSAQHIYGNQAAIMAGDVLFARASLLVAQLGPEAVKRHARAFQRLCMGELHETIGPAEGADPREHYLRVLADKTGSLVAASARDGVLSAGGSRDIADAVARFGEKVGVAFQIADDVIDLVSDSDLTGKEPGTDLLEGVNTMPILLLREHQASSAYSTSYGASYGTASGATGAIDAADATGTTDATGAAGVACSVGYSADPDGREILDLVDHGDLSDPAHLQRVVALLRRHPVVEETRVLARQWADDAISELEPLPDGEIKSALVDFAAMMVDRLS